MTTKHRGLRPLKQASQSPDIPAAPARVTWLHNVKIGSKLTLGFGLLVMLTLLLFGLSALAARTVSETQETVDDSSRVVLASSRAQANLLRMFGAVRGYLALSDPRFRQSYHEVVEEFQSNLDELQALANQPAFGVENRQRLNDLQAHFKKLAPMPDDLFALHDDQMEREPAYNWLNTAGVEEGGQVLITINQMIDEQARRDPSGENNNLLRDMAEFQGSFAAMFSGLRGYVTTRNPNFRYYEYEINKEINQEAWDNLGNRYDLLSESQQGMFQSIEEHRTTFIEQVPDQAFAVIESNEWRRDLYTFEQDVQPITEDMQRLLSDMTSSQQETLQASLNEASQTLRIAVLRTLGIGVVAVISGIALGFIFRRTIAGPIQRLTSVAQQISGGELDIQARVESGDEIGVFAATFNQMTARLRQILQQVRQEKQRADDLLHVVIPIGVSLSSERDFNRLLRNIVSEAMHFCHADRGLLFLREERMLKLVVFRQNTEQADADLDQPKEIPDAHVNVPLFDEQGNQTNYLHPAPYAACSGETVNVADIQSAEAPLDFPQLKQIANDEGYPTVSLLVLPLKNNQHNVLGVLQLINAQDPQTGAIIPFDANLQQMMESFSSLAVAALESYIREQNLRVEIQQLRIEIDEAHRQKQVSEIVDTDFFQDLRAKAQNLRNRKQSETRSATPEPGDV